MERNLSAGSMIPGGGAYGGLDLQGSIRVHHHQQQHPHALLQEPQHQSHPRQGSMVHPSIHEGFPLSIGSMQDSDQAISLADYNNLEKGKNYASDEDGTSFAEDVADGHNDQNRGKKMSLWQRVKWTDTMVRLLITAVSYICEDAAAEYGGRAGRKFVNLQKKGKWKYVSKVMGERGHFVSPQQCEDKFNDLNKRYKRLNEILGRGTSCDVVENPSLLDMMGHIPEKAKEEVRKILSSKHLYYEEMCSYHNGNQLHLPPDPKLQHSLRLALRSRDDNYKNDVRRHPQDDREKNDQDEEMDDCDGSEDGHALHGDHRGLNGISGASVNRTKQCQGHKNSNFGNLNSLDCNRTFSTLQNAPTDMNQLSPEGVKANMLQEQWMKHRFFQLEEQKLQLQTQMLELEQEQLKWQRFCKKKDMELESMKMENERMKLENERIKLENDRMALEFKRKEMSADIS